MLALLRRRQRRAWERMAPGLDSVHVQEMREEHDSLVVFLHRIMGTISASRAGSTTFQTSMTPVIACRCSGYPPTASRRASSGCPVSARDVSSVRYCGPPVTATRELVSLVDEPWRSVPVMQSYWYNNRGRTHPRFRYNQFAFVAGEQRYLYRGDRWHTAPITRHDEPEPAFQPIGCSTWIPCMRASTMPGA